jgi:hypothetical protein
MTQDYMNTHAPQPINIQQFSVRTEQWETIVTGVTLDGWLLVMDDPHYRCIDGKGQVCQSAWDKLATIEEGE